MAYELIYTKHAARDISKIDIVARKRIKKSLERLVKSPKTAGRRLTDSRLGDYRFRIGDYRVIYDIRGSKIVILRIGHRREIYR